jgi:hypothetical protein
LFTQLKSPKELADMVIAEAQNNGKCANLTGGHGARDWRSWRLDRARDFWLSPQKECFCVRNGRAFLLDLSVAFHDLQRRRKLGRRMCS